jgi:hypothetical protein
MNDTADQLKQQWEQNKNRFEQLCTEQEGLYNPDFERVFTALYEIAPDQREVYNTRGWDMRATFPEEIDHDIINQALQAVGIVGDEAARFVRYAEIVLQGKKLMQANALLNVQIEMEKHQQQHTERISPEGWKFYPIHFIAPQPLHSIIAEVIVKHAQTGEGLFTNITEIAEQPDPMLDECLCVEVYSVECSFQPYLDELRRYGVTGTTLGTELTRCLFKLLKETAEYIKANTDRPEAVKEHIFEHVKELDTIPIFGLIFQILILQGLLSLLENCTLKEGDNGFNEAQALCNWLGDLQIKKIGWFAMTGAVYGDEDLQRLQPLCDFLYNTDIGRAVQNCIFKDEATDDEQTDNPKADTTTDTLYLPSELDTDRAREYFLQAVERKWMQPNSTGGYDWLLGGKRGGLARLGYFLEKVYCPTNTEQLPEQALNRLFGVTRLASAITQLHNAKRSQRWRAEIDSLFDD